MGSRVVLGRRDRWGSAGAAFRSASDLGAAADALKQIVSLSPEPAVGMISVSARNAAVTVDRSCEGQRRAVREWAESAWGDPCGAVSFRWKRFSLKEFDGRQEMGTMPLWFKVGFPVAVLVLFPVVFLYAWIRQGLEVSEIVRSRGEERAGSGYDLR